MRFSSAQTRCWNVSPVADVRSSNAVRSPARYSPNWRSASSKPSSRARAERRAVGVRPVARVVDAGEHAARGDEREVAHLRVDDRVGCGHVRRTVSDGVS